MRTSADGQKESLEVHEVGRCPERCGCNQFNMGHEEKGQRRLHGQIGSMRIQADPGKILCASQYIFASGACHHHAHCAVLMLMGKLTAHLVDANGAFLLGCLKPEERIYKGPKGVSDILSFWWIVVFAMNFVWWQKCSKDSWKLLLGIMNESGYECNWADPCLYYKWDPKLGLIVWLSFINDMLHSV